jgi:tetratricopeptide (TPR) repeat protein
MKKRNIKIVMVALIGILILLGGCSSKADEIYQTSIQKGLDAVAEDNFSKAEGLFEIASDAKKDDVRAKSYGKQIALILKADDLVKQDKIEDAIQTLDKSIKVKEGSKVISSKSKDKKEELTALQENQKNYKEILSSAKKLNDSGDYQKSNEKLDVLLKEDLTQYADIKNEAMKLKDSNDESVKKKEIAQAKKEAQAKAAAEAKANTNKVEKYRKQVWYGMDEDPSFTWDDAYNIIVKVLGKEDDTFFYNGRREVFMDDNGRRYYYIWTEDPNASNTAEGTINTFLVYDDGSVEPNQ